MAKRFRTASLLVVLVPWILPAIVLFLQQRPLGVDLRGEWHWSTPDGRSGHLTLPTFFRTAKLAAPVVTLERTIELPSMPDEPWLLVIGDLRYSVLRATINGRAVGGIGVWHTRQNGDYQILDAIQIPVGVLTAGSNELHFEVASAAPASAGIGDRRIVMGPESELGTWFIRTSRFEAFLRSAPLLVSVLLFCLLLVLSRLPGTGDQARLALRGAGFIASTAIFILVLTGIGVAGVPIALRVWGTFLGVAGVVTSIQEFCFDYFQIWSSRWVWANRILALTLVGAATTQWSLPFLVYNVWSLVVLIRLVIVVARALPTRPGLLPQLLASVVLALVLTGIGDFLTNLGVWDVTRIFAFTLSNAQILIGVLVIGTFIELGERNRSLSESLTRSNDELAHALVEAREATRLKSEFLANVSHELRTPLNSIINIPEGLLENFEPASSGLIQFVGDGAATTRHLQTLHRSGLHLLSVVDQVLDFSKVEAGGMTLVVSDVDVASLLEEVMRTLEPAALKRGIRIELRGDTTGRFRADSVKVSQALLNLGSNALKFSHDSSLVTIDVERTAESIRFAVADTGIGIAPENQGFIFEGFRQVEGGATRRFGGTGLGLAISRKLVELHGGTLTVKSALGKGSVFTATLPLRLTEGPRVDAAKRQPCIVVVDDEPIVLETLRLTVRELAIEVIGVHDPRQALEIIKSRRPILVVLDVMMPRVSGVTLLRELRNDDSIRATRVLVLSAWVSNREVVESLGARWMSKPWRGEDLLAVVKESFVDA